MLLLYPPYTSSHQNKGASLEVLKGKGEKKKKKKFERDKIIHNLVDIFAITEKKKYNLES